VKGEELFGQMQDSDKVVMVQTPRAAEPFQKCYFYACFTQHACNVK
jgi:hypothetical protein